MSVVFTFDLDDFPDLLNGSHDPLRNRSGFTVDPDTLACEARPVDPATGAALSALLTLIFTLAVPGNLLVACVIGRGRRSLTPSDLYLCHLAAADGLMALTVPFWATALNHGWIFGDTTCKTLSLIFEVNFYTSVLLLACISVDRYRAVVHANRAPAGSHGKRSRLVCGVVWALGVALALPALFNEAAGPGGGRAAPTCAESFDVGSATAWRVATRAFRHLVGFLLPLGVMLACYGATVARLLRTRGFRKHRAMRVITAVVVAFVACWTPYHAATAVDTLARADLIPVDCEARRSLSAALVVTNALALLHSGVNPLLYAFVGEKFRRNTKALLCGKVRQERASGPGFSRSTSQTSDGQGAVA
ncbi:C-X-C chemokine receptor type 2-like [Syngnathoides biaculeatus]|uniref:C-X-C chemokine receptor type 2-like n=1 Tax=Syngnathoides biaculeatus TaxID=300417 RepID=UPI002ADDFCBC|nr:C-X-C chemokine receptor type 2-like [Syngnathoides biaculeatus]